MRMRRCERTTRNTYYCCGERQREVQPPCHGHGSKELDLDALSLWCRVGRPGGYEHSVVGHMVQRGSTGIITARREHNQPNAANAAGRAGPGDR